MKRIRFTATQRSLKFSNFRVFTWTKKVKVVVTDPSTKIIKPAIIDNKSKASNKTINLKESINDNDNNPVYLISSKTIHESYLDHIKKSP